MTASAADTLIFNVQPQPDGAYCLWAGVQGARAVAVEHAEGEGAPWSVHVPAKADRTFVPLTSPESSYRLRLRWEAPDGAEQVSAEVIVRMRERRWPEWLERTRKIPFSKIVRFNAWHRFARFCARAPAGSVTTLAGDSVDWTDPEVPNGFYQTRGTRLVLARALSGRLEAQPTHPAEAVRRVARSLVWRTEPLPALAVRFEAPVREDQRKAYSASGSVLELMPGVRSRIVRFLPRSRSVARTAIYHEGHTGAGVDIGWETVHWLLERGWAVYCVDMPLCGLNKPDAGGALLNHNDMAGLERVGQLHPMALMVDPVRWVVDRISEECGTSQPLLFVGRSGGGLMAYLYAALDPRVNGAVSIAGGVPLSQRLEGSNGDVGDYEQFAPGFFDLVRHEDLMLAAARSGLAMVFNEHDPDCFALRKGHPLGDYLAAEASRAGARLRFFIDPSHRGHSLGPQGRQVVQEFVAGFEHAQAAVPGRVS